MMTLSEQLADEPAIAPEAPPPINRLSIAHLLLWTTTTAMVLAFIRQSSTGISVSEFANPSDPSFSAALVKLQYAEWLQRLMFCVTAPAYGAALAGAGLAAYRLAARRPGFPTQPGHWLLLLIAVFPLAAALDGLLPTVRFRFFVAPIITLMLLGAISSCAVVFVRKPMRWRVAFGLADIGSAGLTIALGIAMLTFRLDGVSTIASLLAVAASCILAASVLAAIASSILDLRAKDPFDVFHWTGVATLFATIAHLLIVWGITVAMVD